jgi:EmrB/QacA subfamily drug resistance transporter
MSDGSASGHDTPPIGLKRRRAITAGLLLGMSLGALEATVVGTAMPTVIAQLGGLAHYAWVFSAYLLTSTASIPIWGRLSDIYGRRPMYLTAVALFLFGSLACGAAESMPQLIAARAVQGLGAGGIVPLSMTVMGELYSLTERPRVQALFSSMWGVASVLGPLVGGYLTDSLSWRWVFYINVPFALLCMGIIATAYPAARLTRAVRVDWLGALLLFAGVSALLVALDAEAAFAPWLAGAAVLLGLFAWVEWHVPEPILPLTVLRYPVMAGTIGVVFLVGFSLFGALAFVPLFVQGVQAGTATQAGQVLTPIFLGWVSMSVISAKATVRFGYRVVARTGGALIALGFVGLMLLTPESSRTMLFGSCLVMGAGMGLQMLCLLLAVQHAAPRSQLGIATSLNQFSRSIGAAVGVAMMGAIVTRGVAGVPLQGMTHDGGAAAASAMALTPEVRQLLAAALHNTFVVGALAATAGLIGTFFLPPMNFSTGSAGPADESAETEVALAVEADPVGLVE